ncbi:MAG: hypothetical protein ABGZ17_18285 [Planctomycetaceae bacterium]
MFADRWFVLALCGSGIVTAISLGVVCEQCEHPLSAQLGSQPLLWLMAARCQSRGTLVCCDRCQHRFVVCLGQPPVETSEAEVPQPAAREWPNNAPHAPLQPAASSPNTGQAAVHSGPHWNRAPRAVEADSVLWRH